MQEFKAQFFKLKLFKINIVLVVLFLSSWTLHFEKTTLKIYRHRETRWGGKIMELHSIFNVIFSIKSMLLNAKLSKSKINLSKTMTMH